MLKSQYIRTGENKMSAFSSGIIINSSNRDIALKFKEANTYLVKLNDSWLCRLSENNFCKMTVESYTEAVLDMSEHIPLLHLQNAEDHGFEMSILHDRELIFKFNIEYAIEDIFLFNIGKELYGDDYIDVMQESDVQERIQKEMQNRYHEIEKIKTALTIPNYKSDGIGFQMIRDLFDALEIENFSFISYHYVSQDEDIFDIV
jgi:hypothetical protein